MNTDKLVKAIQIIVKEEIKEILPKLVKEGVKKEMTKLLKENKQLRESLKATKSTNRSTFMDDVLEEEVVRNQVGDETKRLSKNPILNEVLSQTQGFNESNTISMNSSMAQGGVEGMRAQMAAKMGLPDMGVGAQPNGIGIDTGNDVVNKALNRDYSKLMKAMDKKKGPWRPGM